MNSLKIGLLACSLTAFGWAQAAPQSTTPAGQQPAAAQPGQAAPGAAPAATGQASAPSQSANISGCMQENWGRFMVSDSATNTTYEVHGSGTPLAEHVNHVVQIKGLPDAKTAQGNATPFYVQQVQDSGQSCGTPNAAASGASSPAA